MKWRPDKRQWRVMWVVYAIVFVMSMNSGPYASTPMDGGVFVILLVIGAAMVLWRMEQKKGATDDVE